MKNVLSAVAMIAFASAVTSAVSQSMADEPRRSSTETLQLEELRDTPLQPPASRAGDIKAPGVSEELAITESCSSINVGCDGMDCVINNNGTLCEGKVEVLTEGAPSSLSCSAVC